MDRKLFETNEYHYLADEYYFMDHKFRDINNEFFLFSVTRLKSALRDAYHQYCWMDDMQRQNCYVDAEEFRKLDEELDGYTKKFGEFATELSNIPGGIKKFIHFHDLDHEANKKLKSLKGTPLAKES